MRLCSRRFTAPRAAPAHSLTSGVAVIPALQALRALAALSIFSLHLHGWFMDGVPSPRVYDVLRLGTDVLLVLSGFLIFRSLHRRRCTYFDFVRRRIGRIYPVFLTMLLIYIGVSLARPEMSKLDGVTHLAANVLLIPLAFHVKPVMTVSWTLGTLALFYAVAPILWSIRARMSGPMLVVLYAGLVAAFAHERALSLVAGMILWELREVAVHRIRAAITVAGCIAVLVLELPLPYMVVGSIAAAQIVRSGAAVTWTVPRPVAWFGDMTYSFYLTHGLVLHLLNFVVPLHALSVTGVLAASVTAFATSTAASAGMYYGVERVFRPRKTRHLLSSEVRTNRVGEAAPATIAAN